MEKDLANYEAQLRECEEQLAGDPENEELKALKEEVLELIQLTKDVMQEEAEGKEQEQEKPVVAAVFVPPPPPPPAQGKASAISLMAQQLKKQQVGEFAGWKLGDKCMTVWLEDKQRYEAVVSELHPERRSATVTFVRYLNKQETPLEFLERIKEEQKPHQEEEEAKEAATKKQKKGEKEKKEEEMPVILPTDAPNVVERKKRIIKQMKRDKRGKEKEQELAAKTSSWKQFQSSVAGKAGVVRESQFRTNSAGNIGVTTVSTQANLANQSSSSSGVRQKWKSTDIAPPDRKR